jgi:hypothetical protein
MEYENGANPPLNCTSFCAGPTAPLSSYYWNDTRASSEYSAVVSPGKVIMGIPYYGRKECVNGVTPTSAPANAYAASGSVQAEGYLDASTENGYSLNSDYHLHRDANDALGNTEWDTWTSSQANCTREMYYDDVTSLGHKYDLVINNHLRGIGIFALSYGGGAPELWSLINLKFGQCSQGAISADHSSPQIPGTSVTFMGSALCAGIAQFRFWMEPPASTTFAIMQDYGAASTWTWDTTGQPLGTYTFQVDARNLGSTSIHDTWARMTLSLARCVTPAVSASPTSPRLPGTAVTLTATVTCSSTPELQFSEQPPGGAWTVVQGYGSAATFNWNTNQAAYGDYNFMVSARNAGSTVASESTQTLPFSLTSCIGATLSTDKTSPQPTGSQVSFTASATCASSPQYRFMIQPPGGSFATVQDFGSSSSFAWNAVGPGGVYGLEVDAKQSTAALSTMSSVRQTFALSACTGATLTTNPPTPQKPGTMIVLTGAATCQGTPQYRFWIHKPDNTVGVVQDWSGTSTYSWSTAGLPYGLYGLRVDVRNTGATIATYETVALQTYSLQAPPCTTPTATTQVVSPQGPGAGFNITASTTTCPQPVYEFWILPPGSTTWSLVQAYSSNPTMHWVPSGLAAGTYEFSAWVRDATRPGINSNGTGTEDAYLAVFYKYAPCASAGDSAAPASTGLAGTTITVTGNSTGCTSPLYEFWLRPASQSSWQLVQAYSANASFSWSTSGPLPVGTYYLGVWVRDSTSPGATSGYQGGYDAYASIPFSLTSAPCTSVSVSASPTSSATAGSAVAISGVANGCPGPLYQFLIRPASQSTWQVVQTYSASLNFSWHSSGFSGTVYLGVWSKDASSSAPYDAVASIPFSVKPAFCASVTISGSPVSPQASGAQVAFTAVAAGCSNANPLYQFVIRPASQTNWQTVQTYSTSPTFNWSSSGFSGTVYIGVWTKDAGSANAYDAVVSTAYAVNPASCASVTISAAPASPQASGSKVTFTAVASGCTNPNPLYQFVIRPASQSNWQVVQTYSASPTLNWTNSGSGTVYVGVWTKDAASSAPYDAVRSTPYNLT